MSNEAEFRHSWAAYIEPRIAPFMARQEAQCSSGSRPGATISVSDLMLMEDVLRRALPNYARASLQFAQDAAAATRRRRASAPPLPPTANASRSVDALADGLQGLCVTGSTTATDVSAALPLPRPPTQQAEQSSAASS
eukprot:20774-Heterococcus_DN1.PRE.1